MCLQKFPISRIYKQEVWVYKSLKPSTCQHFQGVEQIDRKKKKKTVDSESLQGLFFIKLACSTWYFLACWNIHNNECWFCRYPLGLETCCLTSSDSVLFLEIISRNVSVFSFRNWHLWEYALYVLSTVDQQAKPFFQLRNHYSYWFLHVVSFFVCELDILWWEIFW